MIIVEGPDGSGKTRLIKRLGYERRSLRALRAGRGADGDQKQGWGGTDGAPIAYARQIFSAEKIKAANPQIGWSSIKRFAFDRFHISEQIYGPLLRRESGISRDEAVVLRRLLRALGIPIVICLPPPRVMMANVKGRYRPAYQTGAFLLDAYEGFLNCLAGHPEYLWYDYTRMPDWQLPPAPPRCPPGVIGSPTATFLIVGERSTLPLDLPFFSMTGSSGYMNRALWDAGFRESELAFTTAETADGQTRDLRACLLPSIRATIAIIGTAAGAAIAQGLAPVYELPHPQVWKRFHAGQPEGYVDRLRHIRTMITHEPTGGTSCR